MTREQLEAMSKEELNVALTPYMGGYTKSNLKSITKKEMIDLLIEKQAEAVANPKKVKKEKIDRSVVVNKLIDEFVELAKKRNIETKLVYYQERLVGIKFKDPNTGEGMVHLFMRPTFISMYKHGKKTKLTVEEARAIFS